MRRTMHVILIFGLLLHSSAVANTQVGDEETLVIDGVLQVRGDDARSSHTVLQAPDLAPARIRLPALSLPFDHVKRLADRTVDLDRDGSIGPLDLAMVATAVGACADNTTCPEDINRDGIVDDHDIFEVSARLGRVPGGTEESQKLDVGYVSDAPPNIMAAATWNAMPDARRASSIELSSDRALGLRIQFANLSSAYEIRIYDPNGHAVLGPFQSPSRNAEGTWWSPTIYGNTIGIEFVTTATDEINALVLPTITKIVYLYDGCECATSPGTPLGCHLDVTCYSNWANEARAVGQISFIAGGSCSICTGALLNRVPNDFVPLFMTANHCINASSEADSLEVRWLYQTAGCNSINPPGFNDVPRNNGAQILKRHTGTDWTLLGLYNPPNLADPFWLGTSAADWSSGDDATGIHHPNGSFKRISFGTSDGSTDDSEFCGATCWEADVWDIDFPEDNGTTEGGSSGSPIFDSNRRVRGTLSGGPASVCNDDNSKKYGRLDRAWTNLR